MLLCLCVIAAQSVKVSKFNPITAGNAMDVTTTNPLILEFEEPQGWLVFKPDEHANVKISIGVKETSFDDYKWYYTDRSDGVFMMGKYRYARVIIYTDWKATIHYQAGYLDTSVSVYKCSSLSVGRNFAYNSDTGGSSFVIAAIGTNCFVDSYIDVRDGLRVSGGTTANVDAYVVTQTGGAKEYTGASFMTGYGAYFNNRGATEVTVSTTKVESVNPDSSSDVNYGDIKMSTYNYPVRVKGATKAQLSVGNCTSYSSCKWSDDDDKNTGLPTWMVIMIVVICIICLLPAFIVPICICGIGCCAACVAMGDRDTQKRGRRRSSSSSSSSRRKISQTVVVGSDNHGAYEPPAYEPEVPYYNQGPAAPHYPAPYPPAPPVYQGYGVPQQYPGYPPPGAYVPQPGAYPPPPDAYPPPPNPYNT